MNIHLCRNGERAEKRCKEYIQDIAKWVCTVTGRKEDSWQAVSGDATRRCDDWSSHLFGHTSKDEAHVFWLLAEEGTYIVAPCDEESEQNTSRSSGIERSDRRTPRQSRRHLRRLTINI